MPQDITVVQKYRSADMAESTEIDLSLGSEAFKILTRTLYRVLMCTIGNMTGMPKFLSLAWAEAFRLVLDDLEAYNDTFDYDPDIHH